MLKILIIRKQDVVFWHVFNALRILRISIQFHGTILIWNMLSMNLLSKVIIIQKNFDHWEIERLKIHVDSADRAVNPSIYKYKAAFLNSTGS